MTWGMKRAVACRVAVALLLVLAACQPYQNIRTSDAPPADADPAALKIMTYNIRVGYGQEDPGVSPWLIRHGAKKLAAVAAAIRSVDPDIVGLQEVLGASQARRLAEDLGMNFAYVPHPGHTDWWGLAVLSRYEILEAGSLANSSKRAILRCVVDIGSEPLTLLNVHRDKHLKDDASVESIVRAAESVEKPVVLMGDFNLVPGDSRLDILTRRYTDTAVAITTNSAVLAVHRGTWHASYGGRIDYVFVEPSGFEVVDAGLIPREFWLASDHIAYYAVVKRRR